MKYKVSHVIFPKIDFEASPSFYNRMHTGGNLDLETELGTAYKKVNDTRYEVILNLIMRNKENDFNLRVTSLGIFEFDEIENDDALDYALNVNCNAVLFPYIREKISSITLNAGMTPIQMESYNFIERYRQMKEESK